MAVSASVFNPLLLSRVHDLNDSAQGGVSRVALNQRLETRPCSRNFSASALSPSFVTGSSTRWAIGGSAWCRQRGRERLAIRASDNSSGNQSGETETTSSEADVEALEARVGVGRRARRQKADSGSPQSKPAPAKSKQAAKTWDSMTFTEKAWSLYIDPEKGILFWLNKLAYGAIFTIIGGWIVFRFIGPALGWYELDQPLLSPERLLDGDS